MAFTHGPLAEQHRVQLIASMIAITEAVETSGNQEMLDVAAGIQVEAVDIARVAGLPLEVVNAAVRNLSEEMAENGRPKLEISDISYIEPNEDEDL